MPTISMRDIRLLLGDEIKRARIDAGLTQEKASALIGIMRTTLTKAELGKFYISIKSLQQIADVYECDIKIELIKRCSNE